jgi:hypothetical protein
MFCPNKNKKSMTKKIQMIAAIALFMLTASCSKDDDAKSKAADITSFKVDGVEWNISDTTITHTYAYLNPAEMYNGQLTPVITLSEGATVTPASGIEQDFFSPQGGVAYTVTAEDGLTKKTYTAKADIAMP